MYTPKEVAENYLSACRVKAALPLGVQLHGVQREAPQAAPQPVLPQDPQLSRPELPPVRWLAHCSSRFSNLLGWLSPLWQSF